MLTCPSSLLPAVVLPTLSLMGAWHTWFGTGSPATCFVPAGDCHHTVLRPVYAVRAPYFAQARVCCESTQLANDSCPTT